MAEWLAAVFCYDGVHLCCFCTVYHALHFPNSNKPRKTQNVSETALSILSCNKYLNRGYWSANLKSQNNNNMI